VRKAEQTHLTHERGNDGLRVREARSVDEGEPLLPGAAGSEDRTRKVQAAAQTSHHAESAAIAARCHAPGPGGPSRRWG